MVNYILNNYNIKIVFIYCFLKLLSSSVRVNGVSSHMQPFKVICPKFDSDPDPNRSFYSLESNSDYCRCQLHSTMSGKTAIIKCDFQYQEDVMLNEEIFPFKFYNSTSAYVRMSNCRSAYLQATFFYKWMEAPSSAVDLWNCGTVIMESSVEPPVFEKIQTFIGVGIVNCTIKTFPSYFLRDRTRAALRFKECNIGSINKGVFHNIEEMRYFVLEDSYVRTVEGSLSNTGVIQLSRKSMHTWDGLEILNSSIDYVAPHSFNIAHKSDMEDFIINGSRFGKIEQEAFTAIGDIKVQITNNQFLEIAPNALQISVSGPLIFEGNLVKKFRNHSFSGVACTSKVFLSKNTFYVPNMPYDTDFSPFNRDCGTPKVAYMIEASSVNYKGVIIFVLVAILVMCLLFGVIYIMQTKSFILYSLKRNETPLCDEELTCEMEPSSVQ